MSTGLLMASGVAITLALIGVGITICIAVEGWMRGREQRNRRGQLLPLRRVAGQR
jgi:uncharacterized MnhB-related membrane protein